MYDYPNATTIEGLLTYPTQSSPHFWLWILMGIFLIFTLTSFYKEVKLFGKGKLLSSLMVSSFFITAIALLGNLVGFITSEILIYFVIMFSIFTAIFFFTGKDK